MLLDAPGSHGTGIMVDFGAKGHKGPPPCEIHKLARGAAGRDREAQAAASGNTGGSLSWFYLSLKVPVASGAGFVSFVASLPSAKSNLILTCAHSDAKSMARSMEIAKFSPRLLSMHSPAHLA